MNAAECEVVKSALLSCLRSLGKTDQHMLTETGPSDVLYLVSILSEACKRSQAENIRLKTLCGHPIFEDVSHFLTTMAIDDESYIRDASDYDSKCAYLSQELSAVLSNHDHSDLSTRFSDISLALNRRWSYRPSLIHSLHSNILSSITFLSRNAPPGIPAPPQISDGPDDFEGWANVGIIPENENLNFSFRAMQVRLSKGCLTCEDDKGIVAEITLGSHLSLMTSLVAPRELKIEPVLVIREISNMAKSVPLEEWVKQIASHVDFVRRNANNPIM